MYAIIPVKKKKPKLYYGAEIYNEPDPQYPLPPQQNGIVTQQNSNYNPNFSNTVGTVSALGNTAGNFFSSFGETKTGRVDTGLKVGGGILSGAATGASFGSIAGPWGTAIGAIGGAVIGGITSGVQAAKRNHEVALANREQREREAQQKEDYSKAILNLYPTTGIKMANYYMKYGGKMYLANGGNIPIPTNGGTIQPIANNVAVAQGATHEQGGIDVGSAEVEDNEVMVQQPSGSTQVFSDRLLYRKGVTFAQAAELVSKKKAMEEERLKSSSLFAQGTARRNIQKLEIELKEMFAAQEQQKRVLGIENPKGEAGFGDTIGKIMPYVDNITNAYLTMATPEIPKPIYDKVVPMKTDFNIRPQLAELQSQGRQLATTLERNTSNSNTLRNNLIAANVATVGEVNKLYGVKENTETQLKNTDAMNRQAVLAGNTAKEEQYNLNRMTRIDDIHQRVSMNVAEGAQNYQQQYAEDNIKRRDLLELQILKQQYKESGVFDRNLEAAFKAYANGDMSYETFFAKMKEANMFKRRQKATPPDVGKINYPAGVPSLRQISPRFSKYLGMESTGTYRQVPYKGVYQIPQTPYGNN